MVSLVLTIIAFAGAMGVPAFLTAIVESASKIRPSSSRTKASRRMNWIDRCRPVAMLLPRNGTLRARGTSRTPYGTRWKSGAAFSMRKSQTGQREKWLIFESRWEGFAVNFNWQNGTRSWLQNTRPLHPASTRERFSSASIVFADRSQTTPCFRLHMIWCRSLIRSTGTWSASAIRSPP
jgi:hypothetical protein